MNFFKYNILKSFYYSWLWTKKENHKISFNRFFRLRIGWNVSLNIAQSAKIVLPPPPNVVRFNRNTEVVVLDNGVLTFWGDASLGDETRILVGKGGNMVIGKNFNCTGRTDIDAIKSINIGDNVTISVNVQIMDTDHHQIFDIDGHAMNSPCSISIGNKVWIGCTSTILKGTILADNIIIGANSLVCGQSTTSGCIYAGNPIKLIRKFGSWK